MCRGDRQEKIFLNDAVCHDFIKTFAEVCQKTAWPGAAFQVANCQTDTYGKIRQQLQDKTSHPADALAA